MALIVAAFVLLNPMTSVGVPAEAPRATTPAVVSPSAVAPFTASVTWNGQNISSASTVGSAFGLDKGQTALVKFTYTGLGAASVSNATIEMTYLGITLGTSRSSTSYVTPPPLGTAHINWSFGNLYDALEGVFLLTASLEFANGSKVWSESFYVFAKAPYLLESGAVVVFLILAVAELYWGASSIRDARRERKPAPPTPWQAPKPPPQGSPPGTGPSPTPPPPSPAEAGTSGAPPPGPPGGAS